MSDIDDCFEYASGMNFCNLALASVLLDKGVITRDELLDMLNIIIDWSLSVAGETTTLALQELYTYVEQTPEDLNLKAFYEASFALSPLTRQRPKK